MCSSFVSISHLAKYDLAQGDSSRQRGITLTPTPTLYKKPPFFYHLNCIFWYMTYVHKCNGNAHPIPLNSDPWCDQIAHSSK